MLANQLPESSKMGGGAFTASELPLSLSLAAIGVGGMYLASITPSPIKQIVTVGGIGFIVWGILNLFSGEAQAETDVNAPFKAPAMNDFNKVSAKISKPSWNEQVDRGWFSADYDVEIIWTNLSDKAVSVPYRIYVKEEPQQGIAAEPFSGVARTGVINLKAGESKIDSMQIDLKHKGFLAARAVGVQLTVEKISSSGEPFNAASTSFIVR